METIQTILFKVTTSVATTLFIYNSILLFLSNHKNRAKNILAITNLIWGALYLTLMVCDYLNIEITTYSAFSVKTLILSNFFICIMYLYPLIMVHNTRFNVRTLSLLFCPSIAISFTYLGLLAILDEGIENLANVQDLRESLSHFNVWYRFIFLGCNLVYSFILLKMIANHNNDTIVNKEADASNMEITNKAWMNYYFNMIIVLVVFYVVTIFWGSKWNIIIYNTVIIGCFTILFYKGFFHQHITSSNYNINNQEKKDLVKSIQKEVLESLADPKTYSFESKIPLYTKAIRKWLEEERPYLNKDFQLTDVASILPLNRSYLSRVFNEGFKQSFSDVVRIYRIQYAQMLIINNPQLQLNKVAEISGFTSYATFMRAFLKVTGVPPKKYKVDSPIDVDQPKD